MTAAVVRDLSWQDRAACQGQDTRLWIPDNGVTFTAAQKICAGCPVRVECLEYALAVEAKRRCDRHGIWGGLTPDERRQLWLCRNGQCRHRDCPERADG